MTGCEWRHHRQQRVEIGGEVDVHVRDHGAGALAHAVTQCATPTLLVEMEKLDIGELPAELGGDCGGAVRRRVVGDGDQPRERKSLGEVRPEPPDADARSAASLNTGSTMSTTAAVGGRASHGLGAGHDVGHIPGIVGTQSESSARGASESPLGFGSRRFFAISVTCMSPEQLGVCA